MVIDAGAHIYRLAGLVALVASLGCGPEDDLAAQLHEPRVCGQAGPVELLAFEGERTWASVRVVEDRWLLLAGGDGPEQGFESHTIDPCGGAQVRLPENAWPVLIGGRLFACDVNEGSLRSLDPRTGEAGEEIERGLQCDSVAGGPEFALFRRVDSGQLVSVTAQGQVRPTDIPISSTAETLDFAYLESLTAFLHAAYGPARAAYADADGPLVLDDDHSLWRVTGDQSTQVARGVAAFLVVEGVVIAQRLADAETERFEPLLVNLTDGTQREGPEVETLHVEGGYLFTPEGFFEPGTGLVYPLPEGLQDSPRVLGPEPSVVYSARDGLRVWDLKTGQVLIDRNGEYLDPGFVERWNDVIVLTSQNERSMPELWSAPLDGSDLERVYVGTDPGMSLVAAEQVLSFADEFPTDVTHHDLATGEQRIFIRDAVSNPVQYTTRLLEEPVLEGGRPAFFITEREERAVLTMTLLPQRD